MKWITRERVKVDRVACPWLIKNFVDRDAEFFFVPGDKVMSEATRLGATPYDVKDVELGHHGQECSFEAILKKYGLTKDPALVLLGRIVNGADTDNTLYRQPEVPDSKLSPKASAISATPTITSSTRPNGSSTMPSTPTPRRWCGRENRMAISSRPFLLPSPLWGGVGGGGPSDASHHCRYARPPSLTLPHKGGGNMLRFAACI